MHYAGLFLKKYSTIYRKCHPGDITLISIQGIVKHPTTCYPLPSHQRSFREILNSVKRTNHDDYNYLNVYCREIMMVFPLNQNDVRYTALLMHELGSAPYLPLVLLYEVRNCHFHFSVLLNICLIFVFFLYPEYHRLKQTILVKSLPLSSSFTQKKLTIR